MILYRDFNRRGEEKSLSFKSSLCVYLSNYISVSADASSVTVMKFHLNLTSDLGASRRGGLWTFQQANSSYVKFCSMNLSQYLSPKATDVACKAGRATKRNEHEEMDFEPTLL